MDQNKLNLNSSTEELKNLCPDYEEIIDDCEGTWIITIWQSICFIPCPERKRAFLLILRHMLETGRMKLYVKFLDKPSHIFPEDNAWSNEDVKHISRDAEGYWTDPPEKIIARLERGWERLEKQKDHGKIDDIEFELKLFYQLMPMQQWYDREGNEVLSS